MRKRIVILIAGTCFISIGIAFMAKGAIGMSPLSSCPYVFSRVRPQLALGTLVLLWNIRFSVLQIFVDGRNYKIYRLTQIPLAVLMGYCTDFVKWIINPIPGDWYWMKVIWVFVGVVATALGVYMTVSAKLIMNGPEAFLHSISEKTGLKFGNLKTGYDVSCVVLAVILSLVLIGRVEGVREGTLFSAIFTGIFVNIFSKIFKKKDA